MLEFTAVPTAVYALFIVIAVLVEAVAFYVGYGYLEELVGSHVIDTIKSI